MTEALNHSTFKTEESKTKPFIEKYDYSVINCIIDKIICNNALLVFDNVDREWFILQNSKRGRSTSKKLGTKFEHSWMMDEAVTDIRINVSSNIIKTGIQLISKLKFLTVNQNF